MPTMITTYDSRFSRLQAGTQLLKWMVGFNLAFTVAIASKLFFN